MSDQSATGHPGIHAPGQDEPAGERSLEELRAMIDALDRELLDTMVRRMTLVADVAAYKRAHGVRIRDAVRERSVLEDRRQRADALGLPVGEIESIFRVLLRSSRDHQAALRAEIPVDDRAYRIAVIGGHGRIGSLFARVFAELGHEVAVADLGTALSAADAAAAADVVVISVPIDRTEEVIRRVGPRVRADALLMDVTSIKEAPVQAMLESTTASVVGTHPMFGPGVHTLQGQRMVLCRGRGDAWADWLAARLSARGLVVTEATPSQHDRMMALVQVLTHFQTQTLGITLARLGVPLADTMPFTSPAYLLELYVTARHFAQEPGLYGPIEMRNPRTAEVTRAFERAAGELASVLERADQSEFDRLFEEVRAFFGDFTEEAQHQSSYLIDRIVERH